MKPCVLEILLLAYNGTVVDIACDDDNASAIHDGTDLRSIATRLEKKGYITYNQAFRVFVLLPSGLIILKACFSLCPLEEPDDKKRFRAIWKENGGDFHGPFHGPKVKHACMTEKQLFAFFRKLRL